MPIPATPILSLEEFTLLQLQGWFAFRTRRMRRTAGRGQESPRPAYYLSNGVKQHSQDDSTKGKEIKGGRGDPFLQQALFEISSCFGWPGVKRREVGLRELTLHSTIMAVRNPRAASYLRFLNKVL